jgi:type IV fimbrial biogenesis protein FimT
MQLYDKNFGFTLIELLITISIMSVLLLITIPNITNFGIKNRSAITVHNIVSALQFARSTAINHKTKVKYCKSSNHKICGGNWEDGQIIISEDQKLLHVFAALNYRDTLTWNSSLGKNEFIEFTSDGRTNGQVGTFTYIPNGQKKYLKTITINHAGRVKINH